MYSTGQSVSSPTSDTENKKRSKMNKSSYKHIPHREKPPHLVAKRNERERRRVQQVNSAFSVLRKTVPVENRNKRLSKVKTLQRAIEYIESLTALLSSLGAEMPMPSSASSPSTSCNSIANAHHDELAISPDASSSQSQSPFMLIGDADSSISPVGSPTAITTTSPTESYLDSTTSDQIHNHHHNHDHHPHSHHHHHHQQQQQHFQLPQFHRGDSSGGGNSNGGHNNIPKNPLNNSPSNSNSTVNSPNGNLLNHNSLNAHHLQQNCHSQNSHLSHSHAAAHSQHHHPHHLNDDGILKEQENVDESTHPYDSIVSSHNQFHMSSFNQLNHHSFSFALSTGDINSNMNNNCITSHHEIGSGGHNNTSTTSSPPTSNPPSSDPNANSRSSDFTSLYSLQLQ